MRQKMQAALLVVGLGLVLITMQRTIAEALPAGFAATYRSQSDMVPEPVSRSGTVDSEAPRIAVTNAGTVHVVWEEDGQVYYSARAGDGSWSTPGAVAPGERPDIAIEGHRVHLVYSELVGGNLEIFHRVREDGKWSIPRNVSETSGQSSNPAIAVAPDGALHVVWSDTTPGSPVIYYASSDDGGSIWSAAPILPYASGSLPQVTVAGTVVNVVWQGIDAGTGKEEILYTKQQNDGWSLPEVVSDTPDQASRVPRIAIASGSLHVVWEEDDGTNPQVYYTSRTAGGWTAVEPIYTSGYESLLPDVAVDSAGIRHVVWDENSTTDPILHKYKAHGATTWTDAIQAYAGTGVGDSLKDVTLAAGPGALIHVAWAEKIDGQWDVYYLGRGGRVFLPGLFR